MFEPVRLGLALGAGGARGLAHIGVLKALERAGVKISFLSGSSLGALVGGLYAHCLSADEVERKIQDFLAGDLFKKTRLSLVKEVFHDRSASLYSRVETFIKKAYLHTLMLTRSSILDPDLYQALIEALVPPVRIEDLPLDFSAVSTDLKSGRPVLFRSGPLRRAVAASAALPGVIQPLAFQGLVLTDGGVLHKVPVEPLRCMGADKVLAVDVEMEETVKDEDGPLRGIEVLFRVEDIENYTLKETALGTADLVLRPRVGHIHWSDFEHLAEMIQVGQDEVTEKLDDIRRLARRRTLPFRLSRPARARPAACWLDWIEI